MINNDERITFLAMGTFHNDGVLTRDVNGLVLHLGKQWRQILTFAFNNSNAYYF